MHTIQLSSNTVTITPPAATTMHVDSGTVMGASNIFQFTFEVGSTNISDISLLNSFVPDNSTINVSPQTRDFGTVQTGYSRPDAQTFTITNTGNTDITDFDITASGSDYDVAYTSSRTIAKNNGTATFTVQPKEGLAIGNHNAVIGITTTPAQQSTLEAQVSFTVTDTSTPSSFEIFLQKQNALINAAKAGDTVIIESDVWNSYPLSFMKLIQSRRDITVKLVYNYKGVNYTVIIPAGTEIVLDDKIPWFGPDKLADMFGAVTKVIVR